MRITDISVTKRGRFAISVDGEYADSFDELTVAEYRLRIGAEIDEERFEEARASSQARRADEKAFSLLGYRSHTKKELTDKLRRKFDVDTASASAEKMESLGLINDRDYALRYAADLFNLRHFGAVRVRMELRRRGIAEEYIEEALENAPDPQEEISRLLSGKLKSIPRDQKGRKRISDRLAALGYGWDDIKACLNRENIENEDDYDG